MLLSRTTRAPRPAVGSRAAVAARPALRARAPMPRRPQPPRAAAAGADADADEACEVYETPSGEIVEIMCGDYGFRSGFGRMYQGGDGEKPESGLALGLANFNKELTALRQTVRYGPPGPAGAPPATPFGRAARSALDAATSFFRDIDTKLESAGALSKLRPPADAPVARGDGSTTGVTTSAAAVRARLATLTLDDAAVWAREDARQAGPDATQAPFLVKGFYLALCWVLDALFEGRPIQRFWFLETVARMPYFAYISMLHLYESLGWWRAGAELRRVHFAEEWNELHHLQIMEALGGDARWTDRFLAAHASLFYYWACVAGYLASPDVAYAFSELVEGHAVDTYSQFLQDNEAALKSIAPPRVALEYYEGADLYLFDEMVTGRGAGKGTAPQPSSLRRPRVRSLYDVFAAIRDDEGEHVRTMVACRDESIVRDLAVKRGRSASPPPPAQLKPGNGAAPPQEREKVGAGSE